MKRSIFILFIIVRVLSFSQEIEKECLKFKTENFTYVDETIVECLDVTDTISVTIPAYDSVYTLLEPGGDTLIQIIKLEETADFDIVEREGYRYVGVFGDFDNATPFDLEITTNTKLAFFTQNEIQESFKILAIRRKDFYSTSILLEEVIPTDSTPLIKFTVVEGVENEKCDYKYLDEPELIPELFNEIEYYKSSEGLLDSVVTTEYLDGFLNYQQRIIVNYGEDDKIVSVSQHFLPEESFFTSSKVDSFDLEGKLVKIVEKVVDVGTITNIFEYNEDGFIRQNVEIFEDDFGVIQETFDVKYVGDTVFYIDRVNDPFFSKSFELVKTDSSNWWVSIKKIDGGRVDTVLYNLSENFFETPYIYGINVISEEYLPNVTGQTTKITRFSQDLFFQTTKSPYSLVSYDTLLQSLISSSYSPYLGDISQKKTYERYYGGGVFVTLDQTKSYPFEDRHYTLTKSVNNLTGQLSVSDSVLIYPDCPVVGLESVLKNDHITYLSPNPTMSYLNISGAEGSVQIYDNSGRFLFSKELVGERINLEELKMGIYFVTFNVNGYPRQEMFIKE